MTPDWSRVVFSDEVLIFRVGGGRRGSVWRPKGWPLDESRMDPTAVNGGGFVKVWMAICRDGVLAYHFYTGHFSSKTYLTMIAEHLLPRAKAYFGGRPWVFQQDNASFHASHRSLRALTRLGEHHNFTLLVWPARSPDLSPIENFFSILKSEVVDRDNPARSLEELSTRIEDAIATYLQPHGGPTFHRLYDSMPQRIQETIAGHGRPTAF